MADGHIWTGLSVENVPLAVLLGRAAEGSGSLVSVLIGEAVLLQQPLQVGGRLRRLVTEVLLAGLPEGTVCAVDGTTGLALFVPLPAEQAQPLVQAALAQIAVIRTPTGDLRLTPGAGLAALHPVVNEVAPEARVRVVEELGRCRSAAIHSLERGDLRLVVYDEDLQVVLRHRKRARRDRARAFADATAEAADERRLPESVLQRLPLGRGQIASTYVLTLLVPLATYLGLHQLGVNALPVVYPAVVLALVVTAQLILLEGLQALAPTVPPDLTHPEPPASALIAAYLPNEQHRVMETVRNLLAQQYDGGLQVVLAYNTPSPLPVERQLEALAISDPRLTVIRVEHSSSKAANINAALPFCTGEVVGIFDADHLPFQGAFSRAWRWLQPSSGNDVVQGHCVVRDAHRGRLARMVAMEFEAIYAVSHPGRARMHGFGVFGGSNGYWRASRLHAIRMHEEMLTEDIDASARLLQAGGRIVSDPGLISSELAPTSLRALWTQRMRWAQGWHQVSRRHLLGMMTNPHFTFRQRAGSFWLFGWREIYPWISLQSLPILLAAIFLVGPDHKSWVLPMFVVATLFTVMSGPLQVLVAWRLSVPDLRVQRRWWLWFLLVSIPYAEFKNLIGRVAQVKELLGERHWHVTARPASAARAVPIHPSTVVVGVGQ